MPKFTFEKTAPGERSTWTKAGALQANENFGELAMLKVITAKRA